MPQNQNPPNEDFVFLFDIDIPIPQLYSDDSDADSMPSLVTDSDSGLDDSMFFEVRHMRESNDGGGDGTSKASDQVPDSTDENEDLFNNNTDAEEEEYEWTSEDEMVINENSTQAKSAAMYVPVESFSVSRGL